MKAILAEGGRAAAIPLLGTLVANTLTLPLGMALIGPSVQSAFAPQEPPLDYLARSGAELLLRPSAFIANAQDVERLDAGIAAQAQNYRSIETPTVIFTGDSDGALSPDAHAAAIAAVLPRAKLVMVPGAGHMVHFAASERIVEAIAGMSNDGEPVATRARPQCSFAAPPSRT